MDRLVGRGGPVSRADYFFGELPGHPVGSTYSGRKEAMHAGLHDNWVPGISGTPTQGADCIALNRGYVDDEDHGDWILYTGAGGNDPASKRQIADQSISHHHNAALVYSEENGLPVRVLRGPKGEKPYAPTSGYRYDGLYQVTRHWAETGRDGYRIWRFHLVRLTPEEARPWTPEGQSPADAPLAEVDLRLDLARGDVALELTDAGVPSGNLEPGRATGTVQRIVRSNKVAQYVKELHGHRCQICGIVLAVPVGKYSEGAHIRALGSPHHGPDVIENLLCLCPNDHVLFDQGGLYLDDDLTIRTHAGENLGQLVTKPGHDIDREHARYHREHHGR